MMTVIYVSAGRDANGDRRSGWIVTWMDNAFVGEGADGIWSLYRALGMDGPESRNIRLDFYANVNKVELIVPVHEYKRLKKESL